MEAYELQSGMAGNASVYELNVQEAVEMLAGQLVPALVSVLSSVVAIIFVGRRKLP